VTSALLFVALLALVDLSYRRWIRRSISRRMKPTIDLDDSDAAVIPMSARERELSSRRDERQSS
jgi:hypothetical protein